MIKLLISLIIVLIVSLLIVSSLNHLAEDFSHETYENDCHAVAHSIGDRNIVLRVDDIQAYYLQEVQIRMIEDALEKNKTLSLSVIPINLLEDKDIFIFLKENKCGVEIGMHGYDNSDFEFSKLSYEQARERLEAGLSVLTQVDKEIITFIPPNNELSEEAERAVHDLGFRVISSERLGAGYGYETEYGYTQTSYNWGKDYSVNYKSILNSCSKTLDNNKTCVIMLHPQDYTTNGQLDERKYQNYISLLEGLDDLDAEVITFRDLYYKSVVRL